MSIRIWIQLRSWIRTQRGLKIDLHNKLKEDHRQSTTAKGKSLGFSSGSDTEKSFDYVQCGSGFGLICIQLRQCIWISNQLLGPTSLVKCHASTFNICGSSVVSCIEAWWCGGADIDFFYRYSKMLDRKILKSLTWNNDHSGLEEKLKHKLPSSPW